ncbi:hypothetical protein EDB85DRAFT_127673 [Lactarius pseudohatsudake]|nr:hypothetical protein EDB85DRAFT_127673 [Lactarius pseudohatsudake]
MGPMSIDSPAETSLMKKTPRCAIILQFLSPLPNSTSPLFYAQVRMNLGSSSTPKMPHQGSLDRHQPPTTAGDGPDGAKSPQQMSDVVLMILREDKMTIMAAKFGASPLIQQPPAPQNHTPIESFPERCREMVTSTRYRDSQKCDFTGFPIKSNQNTTLHYTDFWTSTLAAFTLVSFHTSTLPCFHT